MSYILYRAFLTIARPLSSFEVKVITTNRETVSSAQRVLAHPRRAIDGNAIGATEIIDGKLSVGFEFDLSMIARNTLIFNDDIVVELATNFDDRFFDAIDLFR